MFIMTMNVVSTLVTVVIVVACGRVLFKDYGKYYIDTDGVRKKFTKYQ